MDGLRIRIFYVFRQEFGRNLDSGLVVIVLVSSGRGRSRKWQRKRENSKTYKILILYRVKWTIFSDFKR